MAAGSAFKSGVIRGLEWWVIGGDYPSFPSDCLHGYAQWKGLFGHLRCRKKNKWDWFFQLCLPGSVFPKKFPACWVRRVLLKAYFLGGVGLLCPGTSGCFLKKRFCLGGMKTNWFIQNYKSLFQSPATPAPFLRCGLRGKCSLIMRNSKLQGRGLWAGMAAFIGKSRSRFVGLERFLFKT